MINPINNAKGLTPTQLVLTKTLVSLAIANVIQIRALTSQPLIHYGAIKFFEARKGAYLIAAKIVAGVEHWD